MVGADLESDGECGGADAEVLKDAGGGRRIVRVGRIVLRPPYPFSRSVHRLLRFLEGAGFDGAPRFLGVDASGSERLSFIDGEAGAAGWDKVLTDDGLVSIATLLRRYHEVVRAFVPPEDSEWSSGCRGAGHAGDIVLHGDPGPWNVVWDGGRASAFLDWDHANPGDAREDLAYLVAYTAPLCSDELAMSWMRHPGVPDRRRRLCLVADAYGVPADGLLEFAANVMAKTNRTVERLAALGLEPQRTWVDAGLLPSFWERQAWVVAHRHELS